MIVQLLGANGAGKSTIVQSIIADRPRDSVHLWNRRLPDGYELSDVSIAGHYEGSACGGGDTLPRKLVLATVVGLRERGGRKPVLIEGPTGREPFLPLDEVRVVYLRRGVEECLEDWVQRNKAKGRSSNRVIMYKRVRAATVRCDNLVERYHRIGVNAVTTESREVAQQVIEKWIGRR